MTSARVLFSLFALSLLMIQGCGDLATRKIKVSFPSSIPSIDLMKIYSALPTATPYAECDQTQVYAWVRPVGSETFLKSGRLNLKSVLTTYGDNSSDPARFGFNSPALNFEVPNDRAYEVGITGMVYNSSFTGQISEAITECNQLDSNMIQSFFLSGKARLDNQSVNYQVPIFIAPINERLTTRPNSIPHVSFHAGAKENFEPTVLLNYSANYVQTLSWRMYLGSKNQTDQVVDLPLFNMLNYDHLIETYFPTVYSTLVVSGVEHEMKTNRCRASFLTGYLIYFDTPTHFRAPAIVNGAREMEPMECE